jgi:probable HAF family extracellular repeat protein
MFHTPFVQAAVSGVVLLMATSVSAAPAEHYHVTYLGPATPTAMDRATGVVVGTELVAGNAIAHILSPSHLSLGTLPGGHFSRASGSANGTVVGHSGTGPNGLYTHAFVYSQGAMRDLGTTGATGLFSAATTVNTTGIICGYGDAPDGSDVVALCWTPGTPKPTVEPTLGGSGSYADALNEAGDVVGDSETTARVDRATGWFVGGPAPIDLQGGVVGRFSKAMDVNEARQVVGIVQTPDGTNGYLWQDGGMLPLPPLAGDKHSSAWAVNNLGDIAGDSSQPNPETSGDLRRRPVLYLNGQPVDLAARVQMIPGCTLETAVGVSDAGQIAVRGNCGPGAEHQAFLLTPDPGMVLAQGPLAIARTQALAPTASVAQRSQDFLAATTAALARQAGMDSGTAQHLMARDPSMQGRLLRTLAK